MTGQHRGLRVARPTVAFGVLPVPVPVIVIVHVFMSFLHKKAPGKAGIPKQWGALSHQLFNGLINIRGLAAGSQILGLDRFGSKKQGVICDSRVGRFVDQEGGDLDMESLGKGWKMCSIAMRLKFYFC